MVNMYGLDQPTQKAKHHRRIGIYVSNHYHMQTSHQQFPLPSLRDHHQIHKLSRRKKSNFQPIHPPKTQKKKHLINHLILIKKCAIMSPR